MKYKIIHGYNAEDTIEIEESEVQRAYYCFLGKKDSIFSGGAIRGSQIHGIKPDYHATMNWNKGYRLTDIDFAELSEKGIDRKMQKFLNQEREVVQYLIEKGRHDLIGKNFEIPKLETPIRSEIKALAESKKI